MVVPYGDPDKNWAWRNAFDEGEYGVGRLASPLEARQDAPANAVFFDADFSDDFGKAYTLKKAVGLYERDGGLLWKHYNIYRNKNESLIKRTLYFGITSKRVYSARAVPSPPGCRHHGSVAFCDPALPMWRPNTG